MSKKPLILIVLALFTFLLFLNRGVLIRNFKAIRMLSQEGREIKKLEESMEEEDAHEATRPTLKEFNGLKHKLAVEKELLSLLTYRLTKAKNVGILHNELDSPLANLRDENKEISDLEENLKENQQQQREIKSQTSNVFEQQRYNQSQSELQADSQIQAQENYINQLLEQIQYLKTQKFDFNAKGQIVQVEGQVREQKAVLQQLKEQRKILSDQGQVNRNGLFVQVQSQEHQLKIAEQQIRGQLSIERARRSQIKSDIDDMKKTLDGEKSSLKDLESQQEDEKNKVQQLEYQLNEVAKTLGPLKE